LTDPKADETFERVYLEGKLKKHLSLVKFSKVAGKHHLSETDFIKIYDVVECLASILIKK
jgi:hypothetical protein